MSKLILAALLLAAAVSSARAETLNLLIWESYIEQSILDRWTARTGVTVHQTHYDSGDARDEILADPNGNVDIVVVGENSARLFGRRGILELIAAATTPAASEYPIDWRARCADFGLPYLWGTMGILYRADKIDRAPTSWAEMMRPAEPLRGHIAMYDDHNEGFAPPLVLLGKSINATDAPTLKAAFDMMKAQAPFVRTYDYVVTSSQNEDYGDQIHMALGYSGDQHTLNAQPNSPGSWRYAVPTEGTLFWLDCLSVTSKSPKKALALDLLDHISSSRSALDNALSLRMPVANAKALEQLPAEIRNDPAVYPPAEVLGRSQSQEELTVDAIQTRRRIISSLAHFRDAQ